MMVIAAVLWGLSPLLYKQGLAAMSIVLFLLSKFAIGAIGIYLFERNKFVAIKKRFLIYFIMFGLADGLLANYIYSLAIQKTSVLHAALIGLLVPFFVYYFASILLKEKIHTTVVFGAIIAAFGLAIIIVGNGASDGVSSLLGDIIMVSYGIVNALLIVVGRYFLSKRKFHLPSEQLAFIQYTASSILLVILSFTGYAYFKTAVSVETIGLMIAAGTLLGAIPIVLYYRAARRINAERLADAFFITPATAMVSGVIILSEPLTVPLIIGAIVMIMGLLISNNKIHPLSIAYTLSAEQKVIIKMLRYPKKAYAYVTYQITRK